MPQYRQSSAYPGSCCCLQAEPVLELELELELVPGLVIHHHHHRPRGLPRLRQERKLGRGCGAQRQLAQES